MVFKKSNLMYLPVVSIARIRIHHSLSTSCQTQIMEKNLIVAHVGARHQILEESRRRDQFQEKHHVQQAQVRRLLHIIHYLLIALANGIYNKIMQH